MSKYPENEMFALRRIKASKKDFIPKAGDSDSSGGLVSRLVYSTQVHQKSSC